MRLEISPVPNRISETSPHSILYPCWLDEANTIGISIIQIYAESHKQHKNPLQNLITANHSELASSYPKSFAEI